MSEGDFLESAFFAVGDGVGFAQDHPLLCLGLLAGGILTAMAARDQDNVPWPEFPEERTEHSGTYQTGNSGTARAEQSEPDFDALVMEQRRESVRLRRELEKKRREVQDAPRRMEDLLKKADETIRGLRDKPRLDLVRPSFSDDLDRMGKILGRLQSTSGSETGTQAQLIFGLYQESAALEQEYLEFDLKWKHARDAWAAHRESAARRFRESQTARVPLDTTEGREFVEVDSDFWTRGALTDALKTLPPLEQGDVPADVFADLAAQADRLARRADEIVRQACAAFVSSQVRIQLGVSVWEQLERRGWRMEREEDLFFDGGDERETLHLKLSDPAGDRLEFLFNPDNTLMMRPEFQGVHNKSVMEQLSRTLQSVLRDNGITLERVLPPE